MFGRQMQPVTYKILLIGSSGVGKSSLLLKYIKNKFSYEYQVTTGVEFYTKNVKLNDRTEVKLQIWDTVGQEAFKSIVRSFYKGVSAIILVYSIDRWESFQQLTMWMKEITENSHQETLIFLVGSKLDLEDIRKVPKNQASTYSKSIDAVFFIEVSAKTGENVKDLFEKMAKTLNKKFQNSTIFRDLVQPIADQESQKTKSFNLRSFGVKKIRHESNCC